ncbi:MAG: VOC family protein [Bacteroidota bacterium]
MNIQFAYTILYVEDVAKTIQFYQAAFGFEQKFITPEKDYGELVSGTTTLAFANHTLGKSNFKADYLASNLQEPAFGMELAFTTDDVAASMQRAIEAGAVELAPAIDKPWGQTVGYLRDLNGFILEICTPMSTGS